MKPYFYPALTAAFLGAVVTSDKGSILPIQTAAIASPHTIPLTLEEVIASSQKIFSGVCVKAEEFPKDPVAKVPSIEFTFKITDGLKGVMGNEIKFKQYNRPELVSGYAKGQKFILFLATPSPKTGFTAHIGLEKGHFNVQTKNGKEFVNYKGKEIPYEDFVEVVKSFLKEKAK